MQAVRLQGASNGYRYLVRNQDDEEEYGESCYGEEHQHSMVVSCTIAEGRYASLV